MHSKQTEKISEYQSEINWRMWTKNHKRETEFSFKHRFLTLL